MIVVILAEAAIIDDIQRRAGDVVCAPDGLDPKLIRRILKRIERKPKKDKGKKGKMTKLNKTDFTLRLKRGLRADLLTVGNYFTQGEPVYTTDTKHLFIADASYIPQPVATLDMAVVFDGEIVTHNSEIVWSY